jgi:hypothetical protein
MKVDKKLLALMVVLILSFSLFLLYLNNQVFNDSNLPWTIQVVAAPTPEDFNRTDLSLFDLDVDSENNPHIVYIQLVTRPHFYPVSFFTYVIWNGSVWQTQQNCSFYSDKISLILDSKDNPCIGWDKSLGAEGGKISFNKPLVFSDENLCFALDVNDNPHVTFESLYDFIGVEYARWDGSKWTIYPVAENGEACSVAVDAYGNPHISYSLDGILMYAHWNGVDWDIQSVNHEYAKQSVIAVDSQENPHISYFNGNLKYAVLQDSEWVIQTVDINVSGGSDMVLDSAGNPHFCYNSYYDGVRYACWDGADWQIEVVDPQGKGGSIALDSNGTPHIVYISNRTLNYAFRNFPN